MIILQIRRAVTRLYIDSQWVHWWGCHRLPSRSFFIDGRQLHLCARCTGLSVGVSVSLLLIPLRAYLVGVFALACMFLLFDGMTQYFGLRESTNAVRFATGVAVGLTFVPAMITIGGF